MFECLFACLRSSTPLLHTDTHPGPKLFHHPRRTAHTPKYSGYGPIHILHARMQRMKPWHDCLRLFHLHAKYRSVSTVWREDTQERGEGDDVCGVSVINYRTDLQPRDYFTQNTMATEPAASPTVPVMAHLKLIPQCPWEKVAQGHTIWYCVWRAAALCRRAELWKEESCPLD